MNQLLRSPSDSHETLFPIREVSRLTGVNPVTLRAWERRYGLITPTRTEGGHRLYSQIDVNTIRSIMAWIERGVAVSKVGRILAVTRDMEARALGPQRAIDSAGQQAVQAQLRQSVNDFDKGRLFQLYEQMLARYSPAQAFEDMLMPVWHEFAERRDAFGQFSEWLFLDSFLRARALQCVSLERNAAEHRVLLVAMPGSCRELELWVAGLLMGTPQVAISVLAPGQPLGELALVCGKVHPDALVLFSNELPTIDLPKRLIRLGLGLNCPMLLAGELADLMQESLQGSAIGCLGSSGVLMQRRLQQFLAGRLDT